MRYMVFSDQGLVLKRNGQKTSEVLVSQTKVQQMFQSHMSNQYIRHINCKKDGYLVHITIHEQRAVYCVTYSYNYQSLNLADFYAKQMNNCDFLTNCTECKCVHLQVNKLNTKKKNDILHSVCFALQNSTPTVHTPFRLTVSLT